MRIAWRIAFVVLAVAACGGSQHTSHGARAAVARPATRVQASHRQPVGGVAFIIGASTDPYGDSRPMGFGVLSGVLSHHSRVADIHMPSGPLDLAWLGTGRLVVSRSTPDQDSSATLYAFAGNRLAPLGDSPLRAGAATGAWSPNSALIATQPPVRVSCGSGAVAGSVCTAPRDTIFVEHVDGSDRHAVGRGWLRAWASNNRIAVFRGGNTQFSKGSVLTLDLRSDAEHKILTSQQVGAYMHVSHAQLGDLAYSADGRYLAVLASFPGNGGVGIRAIVITHANGKIVRVITSTDIISMLAWSPHGHLLAYTTSGFPAPHELYILTSPRAQKWRVLSQSAHFDWVTWSPDDRWLLIDNQRLHTWDLLRLTGHKQAGMLAGAAVPMRRLPRLGGEPQWCCPEAHFAGS